MNENMINLFESKQRNAVVIAPHADDEVLGAGGLMARATASEWKVYVLVSAITGYYSMAQQCESTTDSRVAELESALTHLKVTDYIVQFQGGNEHLRLDTVPQVDLVSFIEKTLMKVNPALVVIPCHAHYNQDHRAVSEACMAALRPSPCSDVPFVPFTLAYGHSAVDWGGNPNDFQPNSFVDITKVMNQKLNALRSYRSQICKPPHLRSLEKIRNWNAAWGSYIGVDYAEAFECLRFTI